MLAGFNLVKMSYFSWLSFTLQIATPIWKSLMTTGTPGRVPGVFGIGRQDVVHNLKLKNGES